MLIGKGSDIRSSEITDYRLYVRRRDFMRVTVGGLLAAAAACRTGMARGEPAAQGTTIPGVKKGPYNTSEAMTPFQIACGVSARRRWFAPHTAPAVSPKSPPAWRERKAALEAQQWSFRATGQGRPEAGGPEQNGRSLPRKLFRRCLTLRGGFGMIRQHMAPTKSRSIGERRPAPAWDGVRAVRASAQGIAGLDRLIHERVRLGILSALAVNRTLTFNELKRVLRTTDGNLSVHARKLEGARYIACARYLEGRVAKTQYRLTGAGRRALDRYLDRLEGLIRATRDAM